MLIHIDDARLLTENVIQNHSQVLYCVSMFVSDDYSPLSPEVAEKRQKSIVLAPIFKEGRPEFLRSLLYAPYISYTV